MYMQASTRIKHIKVDTSYKGFHGIQYFSTTFHKKMTQTIKTLEVK
jgi:hypothetical protein